MNFKEIIKELARGKKVRRPCWEKDSYWIFGINKTICWKNGNFAHVHLKQIKANDWEIFKENSDINLKAKKIVDKLTRPLEKVIKEILEKLE